jgi:hypothetical protein
MEDLALLAYFDDVNYDLSIHEPDDSSLVRLLLNPHHNVIIAAPSGWGKSTLCRRYGKAFFDGDTVIRWPERKYRSPTFWKFWTYVLTWVRANNEGVKILVNRLQIADVRVKLKSDRQMARQIMARARLNVLHEVDNVRQERVSYTNSHLRSVSVDALCAIGAQQMGPDVVEQPPIHVVGEVGARPTATSYDHAGITLFCGDYDCEDWHNYGEVCDVCHYVGNPGLWSYCTVYNKFLVKGLWLEGDERRVWFAALADECYIRKSLFSVTFKNIIQEFCKRNPSYEFHFQGLRSLWLAR